MVVKALRALGHFAVPYARNYKEDTWVEQRDEEWTGQNKWQEVSKQIWDLVLFLECNDDEPQYKELEHILARKKVCWLFDSSYYADNNKHLVRWFNFDHAFLANPIVLADYQANGLKNSSYLPYACDKELHVRIAPKKTRDVVLVGSIRDDRIALADELAKHGVKLELIGDVFREEYIDALASARIVVNQNPEAGRGLLNMRHFEAQAAGCTLLECWPDFKANMDAGMRHTGAATHYDDVSEIALVCNDPHTQDIVDDTIEDFLAHHTYENRCKTILKKMFPHEN
jgi:spore maturation protein CgeB